MGASVGTDGAALLKARRGLHPGFRAAVSADAKITCASRGERSDLEPGLDTFLQAVRLAWESDAFLGQVLYRAKARLQALGVPVLPRLLHRAAMAISQISIGDPVIVHPGVYIVHGQIVVDGLVEIGSGAVISPWVTIGLRSGDVVGPTLEEGVTVGTGAKVLGRLTVGAGGRIGANAVVLQSVEAGETVVGSPARPVSGVPQEP